MMDCNGLDIDLEKFFDDVNHDKLISLVMRNVKNGEIVSLIRKFLVIGMRTKILTQKLKFLPTRLDV